MKLAQLNEFIKQHSKDLAPTYLEALKKFAALLDMKAANDSQSQENLDEFIDFEQFAAFLAQNNLSLDLTPKFLSQDNTTSKFFFEWDFDSKIRDSIKESITPVINVDQNSVMFKNLQKPDLNLYVKLHQADVTQFAYKGNCIVQTDIIPKKYNQRFFPIDEQGPADVVYAKGPVDTAPESEASAAPTETVTMMARKS
jgi:hypothetical protein